MRTDTANLLRPVAPPQLIDDVFTDDQQRRLFETIRARGPWKQIMTNVFQTPEELVATISGSLEDGVKPSFDMFLTTNFQGKLTENGACLFPEIEDLFFNVDLLGKVRGYWDAEYAKPEFMHFIINGPCESLDPAHLDSASFRGISRANAPAWITSIMPKSGLFRAWQIKKAQVVTWFYKGTIGGGFTYWPEGPSAPPQRIAAPFWNRAVIAENEMMYHRGESNGPFDQRKPRGLSITSLIEADPDTPDGWRITTDGEVIQRIPQQETRLMLHWNAEVFMDMAEMKRIMDHTDDLTLDQVFDMFIADMRQRGHIFQVPTDPVRDTQFIELLTRAYDGGAPTSYPADAPGPRRQAA